MRLQRTTFRSRQRGLSFISLIFVGFLAVATFAIGPAGAANAALFAVAMLANEDPALLQKLQAFRAAQTEAARAMVVPPPEGA